MVLGSYGPGTKGWLSGGPILAGQFLLQRRIRLNIIYIDLFASIALTFVMSGRVGISINKLVVFVSDVTYRAKFEL